MMFGNATRMLKQNHQKTKNRHRRSRIYFIFYLFLLRHTEKPCNSLRMRGFFLLGFFINGQIPPHRWTFTPTQVDFYNTHLGQIRHLQYKNCSFLEHELAKTVVCLVWGGFFLGKTDIYNTKHSFQPSLFAFAPVCPQW